MSIKDAEKIELMRVYTNKKLFAKSFIKDVYYENNPKFDKALLIDSMKSLGLERTFRGKVRQSQCFSLLKQFN